ncbi:LLM class flavin-dependent oxidoreductase [Nakamurella lactea]|uniref:LLM class flavin-dependent oxidoreductase n=1 Tax=Nakamurella lactea TaxID=459515 RepID=UPI001B7FAA2E|nr:LLM class flavin-dependent oxidoreductase [Nakamurella lactea]
MTTNSVITPAPRASIGMCFHRTFPSATVTEFARALEVGGVDELWLIEDCFYTTAPPLAAAALAVTDQLTVGLGILPAVARTAAITAMEIATLAGMAPGRVIAGIGHGVQSWMAQMGVATASPLTTLDEVITAVRQLLAGETVSTRGRQVFLENVGLAQPPSPVPPVIAGVRGPKSLAHAGRHADGVLLDGPCPPAYVRWAKEQCAAGDAFEFRCFASMSISDDRADAYRAMAPLIADLLDDGSQQLRQLPFHDELVTLYAAKGQDGLTGMPTEWWQQLGAIGTMDDALGYIAALEAEGVTGISFFPSIDIDIARSQIGQVSALARR